MVQDRCRLDIAPNRHSWKHFRARPNTALNANNWFDNMMGFHVMPSFESVQRTSSWNNCA